MPKSDLFRPYHLEQVPKILAVCSILLLASCSADDPQHYIEQGKVLFQKGELESARVQFWNAIQLDPKQSDAYFQLALLDEKKLNWPGMLNNLLETIALDPKHLQGQLKLGQVYLVGGQFDKASEHAKTALQLNPDNPIALLLQASVQFQRGQRDEAMQEVETVLAKQPFLPEALGLQANILLADKQVDAAIAVLQAGIEHNPAHTDLRLLKIRLEIDNRQFDGALQDYQALIAQHPENVAFRVSLASLLTELGRLDEAESTLRIAINQYPAETELKLKLVDLLEQHHAEQTEKTLQAFVAQLPNDVHLKFRLVDYYLEHRRLSDAENLLQAIVNLDDEASDALAAKIKLAEIALLQTDRKKVENLAEEVLSIDPFNSEALLLRAAMRLNKQDADGAIADLRIVLRDRPKSEKALLLLAQIELLKGQAEVAESLWRQVLEINPNNMAAIIAMSNQLLMRGDYASAEDLSIKAIQANPNDPSPVEMLIQMKAAQKDWSGAQNVVGQLKTISQTALAAKYWEGFLAAQQGYTEDAIKAYQQALDLQPNHSQTLAALTQLYETSGHRADLLAYFKNFSAKNPSVTQAQLLLAQVYSQEKNWAAAESALRQAGENVPNDMNIKLKQVEVIAQQSEARAETTLKLFIQSHPSQAALKFRLASLYADRQQYPQAVAVLQEIVGFNPASKEGLAAKLKLAELAWLQKNPTMAHTLLEEVISNETLRIEALMLRASFRMQDKDTNSAIADLQRVLEKRPNLEPALLMLAKAYQKGDCQPEFIAYLKSLLLKNPQADSVYPMLIMAYAKDKSWAEAEKLLQDKLTLDSKNVQAYVLLARIYADQGKHTAVEIVYREGLAAIGENLQLMAARAKYFIIQQEFDKAIAAYQEIAKKFPENDEAANNLADLLVTHRAGDKKSIAHALSMVERFKDSANVNMLDTYGWVHLKSGDLEKALPALKRAAQETVQDAAVHYHLGTALQQHGDSSDAIVELEKSLALAQQQGDFPGIEDAKALLQKLYSR